MSTVVQKLRTARNHPELVGRRLRTKLNLLPMLWGDGSASFWPATIYVSVNAVCNMRCKMCDVGTQTEGSQFWMNLIGPRQELSLERFKALVDEVQPFKPVIAINSTEPSLYRHLLEICDYAVRQGLEVQITTNGLRLEQQAEGLVAAGVQRIWVSLDGPDEVHNRIRGVKNAFARIGAGVRKINELKHGRGQVVPRFYTNFTISEHNYAYLVPFMEAIADWGFEAVTFSHMNFVTDEMAAAHNARFAHVVEATASSVAWADPAKIDLDVLGPQIDEVRARWGRRVSFTPELACDELATYYREHSVVVRSKRCAVPWQSAQVLANGDVVPISRCFNIPLGNIYESSFAEVWRGEKMSVFRRELRDAGVFPACTRCCGILG